MNKHRSRLAAVALLAALGLTFFIHAVATADLEQGGGWDTQATPQQGYFLFVPNLGEGDYFRIPWDWTMNAFRPVFSGGDFYVVEGDVELPFDPSSHQVLFHGTDTEPACCGAPLEMQRHPGQAELSFVWVLDYAPDYRPTGAQTSNDLLGQPMAQDTTAQERELRYVRASLGAAAMSDRGPIWSTDIAHGDTLSLHASFIVAESLLAAGALVLWGLSLAPRAAREQDGETGRLVSLIQRGREYLRAQLRLQLLVGPLLLTAGFFGAEAIDNGGFSFYDPTGFYAGWIAGGFITLWLLVVAIWIVGLVRVLRALRHYNKTPEPDLGVPVA